MFWFIKEKSFFKNINQIVNCHIPLKLVSNRALSSTKTVVLNLFSQPIFLACGNILLGRQTCVILHI
jgi:hypothetical protein